MKKLQTIMTINTMKIVNVRSSFLNTASETKRDYW